MCRACYDLADMFFHGCPGREAVGIRIDSEASSRPLHILYIEKTGRTFGDAGEQAGVRLTGQISRVCALAHNMCIES
jgi:hypothetical protein